MNTKYEKNESSVSFVKLKTATDTKEKISPQKGKHESKNQQFDFSTSQNSFLTTITILTALLLLQIAISVNPYSGESQPPMFGDYEAQRHWMEITYNLPIEHWYVNGTHNDLLYWGLDYPPLTAYHHNFLGVIARKINKNWVELGSSRGFESVGHKLFMRISAIVPFFILYLPPLIFFLNRARNSSPVLKALAILYPGLLVIDNGHFQYNSISLGLFLATYTFLSNGFTLSGSVFFVAALNYKQMELYHALPVFVFILSRSIDRSSIIGSLLRIAKIGVVVVSTFVLIWLPFLLTGTAKDVLIRVFPFNRGLYEDKVASFWCAFSFILKRLPIQNIQIQMSTALVLICSFPSLLNLFLRPTEKNFRLSLLATALSFFLFSFHVHEKTILLAAIPAILLIPEYPEQTLWILNITNISLFSLCVKDNFAFSFFIFFAFFVSSIASSKSTTRRIAVQSISVLLGFLICVLELYGPKNHRFPHIYQLANAFFCCVHFLIFLVFFTFETVKPIEKPKKE